MPEFKLRKQHDNISCNRNCYNNRQPETSAKHIIGRNLSVAMRFSIIVINHRSDDGTD
ncbi:MAG: hypothetical protein J6V99_04485 [Neisseriaceae bacterium]|nr:hypothetical protein [Neisseriaceae bacterium]